MNGRHQGCLGVLQPRGWQAGLSSCRNEITAPNAILSLYRQQGKGEGGGCPFCCPAANDSFPGKGPSHPSLPHELMRGFSELLSPANIGALLRAGRHFVSAEGADIICFGVHISRLRCWRAPARCSTKWQQTTASGGSRSCGLAATQDLGFLMADGSVPTSRAR